MGATSDAFVFRYPKCIGFIVVGVHLKVCRFLSMGCVGLFELITTKGCSRRGILLGHSSSAALPFVGRATVCLPYYLGPLLLPTATSFLRLMQNCNCITVYNLRLRRLAIKPSKPRPDSSIAYVSGSGIAVGGCPGA